MKTYTAHLKPGHDPVLVREAWSWGAFLFGPLWLLSHRAWVPAVLHAAALGGSLALPAGFRAAALGGLLLLAGLLGRDAVRWSLDRRGFVLAHVLAARDADTALGRLFAARTDIATTYAKRLA